MFIFGFAPALQETHSHLPFCPRLMRQQRRRGFTQKHSSELPHIRTIPGHLHSHLQPRSCVIPLHSDNEETVKLHSDLFNSTLAQICADVFVCKWHFNDTVTFWAKTKLWRHRAIRVFSINVWGRYEEFILHHWICF